MYTMLHQFFNDILSTVTSDFFQTIFIFKSFYFVLEIEDKVIL